MNAAGRKEPSSRARLDALFWWLVTALTVVLVGCSSASRTPASTSHSSGSGRSTASAGSGKARWKVMVIAEENHTYAEVFGAGHAPYLTGLARTYSSFEGMDAGRPTPCPSYLLMTSGSSQGVCGNPGPTALPISGPSIFSQLQDSGMQWREYAESMPAPCMHSDAGHYLVRHAPATYYTAVASRCPAWDLPLGTTSAGALHDDVGSGRLPDYAFVTPDACHDMHGARGCPGDLVRVGDQWLAGWLPQILAGPDYQAGRLVVVVTWDEGSHNRTHIPTVVIGPTIRGRRVTGRTDQCALLALEEHLLGLAPLGCASTATSPAAALGLP